MPWYFPTLRFVCLLHAIFTIQIGVVAADGSRLRRQQDDTITLMTIYDLMLPCKVSEDAESMLLRGKMYAKFY